MLLAITAVDYGVLVLYLLAMLAIGAYFNNQQKTTKDFFLAGRSMGWFPVGLSIMATLLSAMTYTGAPGEGYYSGLKMLALPAGVWLITPLMLGAILPLYHRLNIYSVYEYLELRFGAITRYVGSALFVLWRLLWLGGVLYAPCKVLVVAAGLNMPVWLLMIVLGAISTAYTFLGGMKAVIWTDVIQSLVMMAGVVLMIGSVWLSLDGGAERVWQVNQELDRGSIVDTAFSWSDDWSIWAVLPHFALAMLSFYVADQITAQRYLTAESLKAARRSFVLNSISVSLMVPALCYIGMALLAYYHDHPQDMNPKWVVNVDNSESKSPNKGSAMTAPRSGGSESSADKAPLIGWDEEVSKQTVSKLVGRHHLLDPNTGEPVTSVDEVLDPATGEIDIEKIGRRLPPPSRGTLRRGEFVLNKNARGELMPHFINLRLKLGLAGLILAALLAASMSSMDSGLNSICTLLIMDFHRRLGWGRRWLAERLGKPVDQLDETDELRLGRPLVVIIGVAATLCALFVGQIESIWDIMIKVINTVGGPLLGVFLLGVFTRRATGRSALVGLAVGTCITVYLVITHLDLGLKWLWPFATPLNDKWHVIVSVTVTFVVGYLGGFLLGGGKSKEALRGLVVGIGTLGERTPAKSAVKIEIHEKNSQDRWK